MSGNGALRCGICGRSYPEWDRAWRCDCGGPLTWHPTSPPDPDAFGRGAGPWRYAAGLPSVLPADQVTLGETTTPLLADRADRVTYKLEFLSPSGSFKDRGACVMAGCLRTMDVERVTLDSSGNAGAANAAYLAAARVDATVFVPAHASAAKLRQIASYGATLEPVTGDRAEVTRRTQQVAADAGALYASHLWSPFFVAGMRTFAFELWEQLRDAMPAQIVLPVGTGSLLLGAHEGFSALREAGLLERLPRLFGIQAACCAPLVSAFERGAPGVDEAFDRAAAGTSAAEGIMIALPPRDRAILGAVRASEGALVRVDEAEIETAWSALARRGLLVEPTSAVAEAGLRRLLCDGSIDPGSPTVVALTGSGLKALD